MSFSPDGGRALWVTGPGVGGQVSGEQAITVMSADFSAPMTINHPGEDDTQASFSPDGKRIVYVRTIHGRSEVVTSELAGANVRVLGGLPSHALSPELFPSGRRILVVHNTTIWSARSDGQHAHALIPNGTAPDISPDGRSIAYIGVKSGAIYVAHADGTHRHKLSLTGALCRPPRCSGSAQAVVFSPDGTKLAFAWNSDPVRSRRIQRSTPSRRQAGASNRSPACSPTTPAATRPASAGSRCTSAPQALERSNLPARV